VELRRSGLIEGRRWLAPVGCIVSLLVLLAPAGALGATPTRTFVSGRWRSSTAAFNSTRPKGQARVVPREWRKQGYLVPRPARYERAKRHAQEGAPASGAEESPKRLLSTSRRWVGIRDPWSTPPDTTDAVGPTRYVELVNTKFAIYNRHDDAPISAASLRYLMNARRSDFITDPQVIWDPSTRRFYYAALDFTGPRHHYIALGFSRGASPNRARDWCKYAGDYGRYVPDFPKLGDTKDFVLIGLNTFLGQRYVGSDVVWSSKPRAGSRCPRSLRGGTKIDLKNANGSPAFTPVPANQIDDSRKGWVLATPAPRLASLDHFSLFRVRRNADGSAAIQTFARDVSVGSYETPGNAPQLGSTKRIDTLDGRLTQAVSAIDPSRPPGERTALWTQHTVQGGAGSEVRWYEIDPGGGALFQSGSVTDPSLHVFNGAVAPDRAVNGASRAYGSDMVLNFNTSSASTEPDIRVVSKVGSNPQSPPVVIKTSPDPLLEPGCRSVCRWGDYPGASPDPTPPSGSPQVWMANQWVSSASGFNWRTMNFIVSP